MRALRFRIALLGLIATAALAAPGAARGQVVDADPAGYCQGAGGALGLTTDSEHRRLAPEPALPAGVRASRLSVEGIETRVLQAGPARARDAVLFVHGSPDSARDWDDLLSAGGRFARTIAFDVPGYGQSDKSTRGLRSTAEVGRYIQGVLNRLGVERVVLAAHDFGGPWGLSWATAHLPRLRGAVMINTGALIDYVPHPLALQWATPGVGETQVGTTTRESFRLGMQQGGPLPESFTNRVYDDYDRGTRCSLLRYYRASIPSEAQLGRQQAAALRPRNVPALVVWGRNDPFIPVEQAERQRQAFPSARVEILDNSGHWPFIDAADRTRSLVVPFLRPRLLTGRPRTVSRGRAIRLPVRAEGVLPAHEVRVQLRRVGSRRALTRPTPPVTAGTEKARYPRARARKRLRRGRYVATVTARGLEPRTVAVRVR